MKLKGHQVEHGALYHFGIFPMNNTMNANTMVFVYIIYIIETPKYSHKYSKQLKEKTDNNLRSTAAWCISFLGIHPTLTQVPPRPETNKLPVKLWYFFPLLYLTTMKYLSNSEYISSVAPYDPIWYRSISVVLILWLHITYIIQFCWNDTSVYINLPTIRLFHYIWGIKIAKILRNQHVYQGLNLKWDKIYWYVSNIISCISGYRSIDWLIIFTTMKSMVTVWIPRWSEDIRDGTCNLWLVVLK